MIGNSCVVASFFALALASIFSLGKQPLAKMEGKVV